MSKLFKVFIVEDAEPARRLLETALSADYAVETFPTAEDCMARVSEPALMPNLFLLDVDLPGINGFDLCRQIHQMNGGDTVPVIFVSALDDLESRLEGYKAGGSDFVVKPYKIAEIRQKVEVAQRLVQRESMLHLRVAEANSMACTVMSSLGEYAGLLNFLRELNYCEHERALAEAFLGLLAVYQLRGAIQLRLRGNRCTFSPEGENRPLEESVIAKVSEMGRIVEFKQYAAYNYDRVSILINNMPLADPDTCGRIRDNLCIAAESIETKLNALETASTVQQLQVQQAQMQRARTQSDIGDLVEALQQTIEHFNEKYTRAQHSMATLSTELQGKLLASFAYLGLNEAQEGELLSMVHDKISAIAQLYNFSAETQQVLAEISERLRVMQKQ